MKKEVIYIDIEDDITGIIQKVKASPEKIVALVPPKGNAVLQSVVNLKLLKRAAGSVKKQLVIVTANQALLALAGGLELYVAKNLQSKPVVPAADGSLQSDVNEPVELDDDPQKDRPVRTSTGASDDNEVELTGEELASLAAENEPIASEGKKAKKPVVGKKNKVPNFDSFKKKLIIGGAIVLLFAIGLLAIFGRAKADIVVRAETTPVDVALEATLSAGLAASDPENFALKALQQEKKQTLTQAFTPTGEKDVGEKAKGTARFSTDSISALNTTIPAGTRLTTSEGLAYTTASSVTISFSNASNATVDIIAVEAGPKFNGANGSLSGAPRNVSASIRSRPSGGTTQVVKVVSQEDVDRARTQLEQQDSAPARNEIKALFKEGVMVLDDSFSVNMANVRSEPAVGEQSNEAQVVAEVTYTMLGAEQADIGAALDSFIASKMTNREQQRVYENNLQSAKFEKVSQDGANAVYKISALAYYGPQFDTEKLKTELVGKKFGEARAYLQDLPGVKGVDIKLSPFWARQLPGAERTQIKLDVDQRSRGS